MCMKDVNVISDLQPKKAYLMEKCNFFLMIMLSVVNAVRLRFYVTMPL